MARKMDTVSIAVTAALVVDGHSFDLTSLDTTMVSQGLSSAVARPAVGLKAAKSGGSSSGSLRYDRGTPAQIIMDVKHGVTDPVSGAELLRSGQHVVFDGLYDDAGPSDLANGVFAMQVQLVSKYAQLDTGSLQYGSLFPNSFLDTTVPIDPTGSNGQAPGKSFDAALIAEDFWSAMMEVMHTIAVGGASAAARTSLQEYEKVFGSDLNTAADAVLSLISGKLTGGPTTNLIFAQAIRDYLNALFTQDMRYQSFFHRLIALGQEFKYRMMEHPLGLAAVPYSPFFSDPHTIIAPSTIYSNNWTVNRPGSCLGVALTRSGGSATGNALIDSFLVGAFKRKSYRSVLGTVTTIPCPPWMVGKGLVDESTQMPLQEIETRSVIGDPYAKELAMEYAYIGRAVTTACPLRMDIGPLTAVEIQYPKLPGVDLGTSIYGSVQMVKLMVDAAAKKAATVMEVGFVRSQVQQREFADYEHPMWANQYMGGRLDEQPAV